MILELLDEHRPFLHSTAVQYWKITQALERMTHDLGLYEGDSKKSSAGICADSSSTKP